MQQTQVMVLQPTACPLLVCLSPLCHIKHRPSGAAQNVIYFGPYPVLWSPQKCVFDAPRFPIILLLYFFSGYCQAIPVESHSWKGSWGQSGSTLCHAGIWSCIYFQSLWSYFFSLSLFLWNTLLQNPLSGQCQHDTLRKQTNSHGQNICSQEQVAP